MLAYFFSRRQGICHSRLVRVFLGTLWSSIKQIKAPYMCDWERGIALHGMPGNQPHLSPRGKSHGFSRVAVGTWGIFSRYGVDGHSKLMIVLRCQDSCLVMMDTSGI